MRRFSSGLQQKGTNNLRLEKQVCSDGFSPSVYQGEKQSVQEAPGCSCAAKGRGRSPWSPHPAPFLAQMTPLKLTAMQHWLWVLSRPAEIHRVLRDEAICCLSTPLRAARAKIHPKKTPKKAAAEKLRARLTSQVPLTQHHRVPFCLEAKSCGE